MEKEEFDKNKQEQRMNKDEILKQAQREGEDEREVQVRDKSLKWTYIVMVIMAAAFAAVRKSQGLPMMDLCATVCLSVCAGQIYRYIKLRDKGCLILGIVTFVVAVVAVIRFFMGH